MNTPPPQVLMTLPEASLFKFGTPKRVSTLRTAIRKGELVPKRIAGTFFVSAQDLEEMDRRCQEDQKGHISMSEGEKGKTDEAATSSATGKRKLQQDAALMKLKKLTFDSQNTSDQSSGRNSGATVVSIAQQS